MRLLHRGALRELVAVHLSFPNMRARSSAKAGESAQRYALQEFQSMPVRPSPCEPWGGLRRRTVRGVQVALPRFYGEARGASGKRGEALAEAPEPLRTRRRLSMWPHGSDGAGALQTAAER